MSLYHQYRTLVPSGLALLVFNILIGSCTYSTLTPDENISNTDTVIFNPQIPLGTINNPSLKELSGIITSSQDKTSIWAHNDSGDSPTIYLIDDNGNYKFKCHISDADNRDWEDISIFKNQLYIGDTGDNRAVRSAYTIYIVDEPSVQSPTDITVNIASKITYKYPDGSKDAETLMVDPLNGDIYIVSKREVNVSVYIIPFPYDTKDTVIAEKVMTLPFTYFVGGDISRDGKEILMKTYQKIYYWPRKDKMSIAETFALKPQEILYHQEPQGEAISWSSDSKSFYTISEESPLMKPQVVYRYDKQ